jgi:hypothetical protein
MASQKQRQERLHNLALRKKNMEEDGSSEVLIRHLLDDYMVNIWQLGHQTRTDYMDTLFRSQKRDE